MVFSYSLILGMLGIYPAVLAAQSLPQCPDSELTITGGKFTLTKLYNDGSILRYKCPEGYYPFPIKKRNCYRGRWDPAPNQNLPECKKVFCPNPKVLENGIVHPHKDMYFFNDTTTYTCFPGFTFRGSSTRVCQVNGKWSGRTPTCALDTDHCYDPGTPPGASRSGHVFNIDDKVTYHCNNNLKLLGSKERVCQGNGQWSGKEPECYADFTYDTPEEVAEAFGMSLKTILTRNEEPVQFGRKIRLLQEGKLDIYIALDVSDSIEEHDFENAKKVIMNLIETISYYDVFPNYEIIIFATEVTKIVTMADFKKGNKNIDSIFKDLMDFSHNAKGENSGTNIAKAYRSILESMRFEKAFNLSNFLHTHHVIIMFTDGLANMGGHPRYMVEEIKRIVYNGEEELREQYLDLFVFGLGVDVKKSDLNEWVTKRSNEMHLYLLNNMDNIQETFDNIIDEADRVGQCGLYRTYEDTIIRTTYPWFLQISINEDNGRRAKCSGSLVTPRFVLTAAQCLKSAKIEGIFVEAPNLKEQFKVKSYITHPKFNPRQEIFLYDVALIELEKEVAPSIYIRPICIPCTEETSRALHLTGKHVTCKNHKEEILKGYVAEAFFRSSRQGHVKKKAHIKVAEIAKMECITMAEKVLRTNKPAAVDLITNNYLCTGGTTLTGIDDVSCQGDSGGATYVERNRLIQVGIVSWGFGKVCTEDGRTDNRDFHTDLFNPEVQSFLKKYLSDGQRGQPLSFIN